jgi:hypothetical protein
MANELRDYLVAAVLSISAAVGVYFLLEFFLPGREETIAIALVAGVGLNLVFDRYFYSRALQIQTSVILARIRDAHSFEKGFRIFEIEDEAIAYAMAQLDGAKKIWNTRLSEGTNSAGVTFRRRAPDFDRRIFEASKNGAQVRIVIAAKRIPEIKATLQEAKTLPESKRFGSFVWYEVDFQFMPVTQILYIQDGAGHEQVLVGWSLGSSGRDNYKVALFLDSQIVNFYKEMFERYAQLGKPNPV